MLKTDKIYVAGATGLVGSAIVRKLESEGYHNLITKRVELTKANKNPSGCLRGFWNQVFHHTFPITIKTLSTIYIIFKRLSHYMYGSG